MNITTKRIVGWGVMLFIIALNGCNRKEISLPAEYESFDVNLSEELAPIGFQTWNWGVDPDSAALTGTDGFTSLGDLKRNSPEWVTIRKSGIERYNLGFMLDQSRSALAIPFSSLQLLFHPNNGFFEVKLMFAGQIADTDSSLFGAFNLANQALKLRLGEPHNLEVSTFDNGVIRKAAALWKGDNVFVALTLYEYLDGKQRIYQVTRKF